MLEIFIGNPNNQESMMVNPTEIVTMDNLRSGLEGLGIEVRLIES